jgi:simple sugar transport system substrate-binding protein
MRKKIFLALIVYTLAFTACVKNSKPDAVTAATAKKGPPARVLLKEFMPDAAADGSVKIAVLVNLMAGENSRQFIEGCVSEGRSMDFTVDAFGSGADEKRCRTIAEGIALADYDGLIFAYGDVDFSYDILKPIADKGIPIVTFEALPYRDGKSIKNLITTFQDDYSLAGLSIETLLSLTPNSHGGPGKPARIIRVGCEPGITFLDRRAWAFEEFVNKGRIEEAALVKLDNTENPHGAAWEALAAILPRFPPGTVDGLWIPWEEFAGGCAEALASAGRQDIKLTSIGISNDVINLMLRHHDIWLASAAVDPKLAGTVNMRILAAMLAGESVNDTFSFSPQLVKTTDLNIGVNLGNISVIVPGWGEGEGLFDNYQWMIDLKAAGEKYLRIPPIPQAATQAAVRHGVTGHHKVMP